MPSLCCEACSRLCSASKVKNPHLEQHQEQKQKEKDADQSTLHFISCRLWLFMCSIISAFCVEPQPHSLHINMSRSGRNMLYSKDRYINKDDAHWEQFETIIDHLESFLTISGHCGPLGTHSIIHYSTIPELLGPFWKISDNCGPFWSTWDPL